MKRLLLAAIAASLYVLPSSAVTIDYNTLVKFSDLEAINDLGFSTWAAAHPTTSRYTPTLVGVVLNDPADMLDYSDSSTSPQWQTFIQAVNPNLYGIAVNNWSDYGGTAMYMMKYNYKGSSQYYDDAEWLSEMERLNYPLLDGNGAVQLSRGDVVVVQAYAPGMEYMGKFNINEQHMKADEYNFTITVLAEGAATPATPLTLSDLVNPDNTPIFDQTRQAGCERHQGTLVHLDNLVLYDDPNKTDDDWTNWKTDGMVTVKQLGQGDLTFDLKLGMDSDLFAQIDAASLQTIPFSVKAILDQESADRTAGYKLWLTSRSDITVVPEPGSLALLAAGVALFLPLWRRKSSSN